MNAPLNTSFGLRDNASSANDMEFGEREDAKNLFSDFRRKSLPSMMRLYH